MTSLPPPVPTLPDRVGIAPPTTSAPTASSSGTSGTPATAGSLLFDSREQAEAAVDGAASKRAESRGPGKLSQVARKVARREIRRAIVDLLDIGLSNVVLRAWQGHDALLAAGRRTAGSGGREIVLLADHTVTSTHSPHVSLTVDDIDLGQITTNIVISLQLIGINAVVQRGELVAVQTGSIAASAKLSVEGVPITSRSKTLEAVAVVHLPQPVRLAAVPSPPPPRS